MLRVARCWRDRESFSGTGLDVSELQDKSLLEIVSGNPGRVPMKSSEHRAVDGSRGRQYNKAPAKQPVEMRSRCGELRFRWHAGWSGDPFPLDEHEAAISFSLFKSSRPDRKAS